MMVSRWMSSHRWSGLLRWQHVVLFVFLLSCSQTPEKAEEPAFSPMHVATWIQLAHPVEYSEKASRLVVEEDGGLRLDGRVIEQEAFVRWLAAQQQSTRPERLSCVVAPRVSAKRLLWLVGVLEKYGATETAFLVSSGGARPVPARLGALGLGLYAEYLLPLSAAGALPMVGEGSPSRLLLAVDEKATAARVFQAAEQLGGCENTACTAPARQIGLVSLSTVSLASMPKEGDLYRFVTAEASQPARPPALSIEELRRRAIVFLCPGAKEASVVEVSCALGAEGALYGEFLGGSVEALAKARVCFRAIVDCKDQEKMAWMDGDTGEVLLTGKGFAAPLPPASIYTIETTQPTENVQEGD